MRQTGAVPRAPSSSAPALWERAVATARRGDHAAAVRLIDRALAAPDLDDATHVRCLVTLALARSELEGVDAGLAALDGAAPLLATVPPAVEGVWHCQRALMLLRAGRLQDAAPEFDRGAALAEGRDLVLCHLNRGVLRLRMGQVAAAEDDCRAAIAAAGDMEVEAAKAQGNLGYLAFLRGDVPEALRLATHARTVLGPLGPWLDGISAKGLGEMLLAAGLLGESEARYREAVTALKGGSHRQDRGEAQLGLAEIARLRGQWPLARSWARRAQHVFTGRGATGWALLAELELVRADCATRPALGADAAGELADRLDQQGMREEASVARLLRASALVRAGRADDAAAVPRGRWVPSGARVSTRMLAHETRAAHEAARRKVGCGATDPAHRAARPPGRAGAVRQPRPADLGHPDRAHRSPPTGSREALRRGRPDDVLLWSEQVRATGYRVRPVRPPAGRRGRRAAREAALPAGVRAGRAAGDGPCRPRRTASRCAPCRSRCASGRGRPAGRARCSDPSGSRSSRPRSGRRRCCRS